MAAPSIVRNFARRGDGSGLNGLGVENVRLCEEARVVGSGKRAGWLVASSEPRLGGRKRDERLRRWPVGKRKGGSGRGDSGSVGSTNGWRSF